MEIINKKSINITPHKSIYRKMGRSSHGFNESIAELVDNSIDAMTAAQHEGKEPLVVEITIDQKTHTVSISDNGRGMGEHKAGKAVVLAESSKSAENLGEYGFGLKTAALSIGKEFHVRTGEEGATTGHHLRYNEEEWETDPNLTWESFPFNEIKQDKSFHGTTITIEKLKIKLLPFRVSSLREDMAKRYRAYITSGKIKIFVNDKMCRPEKVKWAEGYPKPVNIKTQFGEITGIIGLMCEGSQKGLYGFDLFRKGRMVRTYEKFAIQEHPMMARIMGEIHLDFVPITHEKNRFIEESEEYEEAEKACKESEIFKAIIREARKTASKETVTKQVQDKTQLWEDHLAQAFRNPELNAIINPNVKNKPSKDENSEDDGSDSNTTTELDVEKREPKENPSERNDKEPETNKERTPKETHPVIRHVVSIFGKTFKFKHEYRFLEGMGRKDYYQDDKEGLVIITNMAFPAYIVTDDKPFYAAMNITEAIAEIYAKESGPGIEKMNEAKDLALRIASNSWNQIKDDVGEKQKTEKRTHCEGCGVEIDFKSPLVKFCPKCSEERAKAALKRNYMERKAKKKKDMGPELDFK